MVSIFWWLGLSREIFGYSKQCEDCWYCWRIRPANTNIQILTYFLCYIILMLSGILKARKFDFDFIFGQFNFGLGIFGVFIFSTFRSFPPLEIKSFPSPPLPTPGQIHTQQRTENSFTGFKMQLLAHFPRENGLKQRRNT